LTKPSRRAPRELAVAAGGGGREGGMDWYAWLCRAGLHPDVAFEYARLFARNELAADDLRHLDHGLLATMGVPIAKHRLEILKLARRESPPSSSSSSSLAAGRRRRRAAPAAAAAAVEAAPRSRAAAAVRDAERRQEDGAAEAPQQAHAHQPLQRRRRRREEDEDDKRRGDDLQGRRPRRRVGGGGGDNRLLRRKPRRLQLQRRRIRSIRRRRGHAMGVHVPRSQAHINRASLAACVVSSIHGELQACNNGCSIDLCPEEEEEDKVRTCKSTSTVVTGSLSLLHYLLFVCSVFCNCTCVEIERR
ncbi:Os06g0179100, partial [Oryza sativa Japonica Group]